MFLSGSLCWYTMYLYTSSICSCGRSWTCFCSCVFSLFWMQWAELIEAWSEQGDCSKNLYMTACGRCRLSKDWLPEDTVRLISAVSRGSICSRPLLMDLQDTEWGETLVRSVPDRMLPVLVHSYAAVTVNAPKLLEHAHNRLERLLIGPSGGASRSSKSPEANLSKVIDVAWSFAVLGHNAPKILAHAMYSGNKGE